MSCWTAHSINLPARNQIELCFHEDGQKKQYIFRPSASTDGTGDMTIT